MCRRRVKASHKAREQGISRDKTKSHTAQKSGRYIESERKGGRRKRETDVKVRQGDTNQKSHNIPTRNIPYRVVAQYFSFSRKEKSLRPSACIISLPNPVRRPPFFFPTSSCNKAYPIPMRITHRDDSVHIFPHNKNDRFDKLPLWVSPSRIGDTFHTFLRITKQRRYCFCPPFIKTHFPMSD